MSDRRSPLLSDPRPTSGTPHGSTPAAARLPENTSAASTSWW
jgi:hypothetical protein